MRAHRHILRSALAATLALLACAGTARAAEIIDGNNPPTVRNNMHSCPPGHIMTGVHVNNNQLLCTGPFEAGQSFLTVNEQLDFLSQWPPDAVTRAVVANSERTHVA